MANEAILRERTHHPMDFTVADGTGIEKGAVLKLTDPRTAIITSAQGDVIAGIAAREKVASDGRTRLAVFQQGVFDMTCSGAVTLGEAVYAAAQVNQVAHAGADIKSSQIIGHALETGADDEQIQIMVNVGAAGNQVS